ncbi:MAG TPA: PQQ-dependent sugar dehydrogenase, partial [Solirubrobacteraceae bacterium]|nr:PQQ-dependent sugar dehydrogenase [Solirubrobacteraceae bacterium]
MKAALVALLLAGLALAACGGDEGRASSEPEATTAQRAAGGVRLRSIGRFDSPVLVTAPRGDARLFVVERGGRVRVVRGGRRLAAPFLDLSRQTTTDGERGLLSIAFPPDYTSSGLFYVSHTDVDGNSRVAEYRVSDDPDRADPSSRREVLFQRQPEENHNGGLITFGPDGLLYVGLGDGGGGNDQHGTRGNAQDLGTLL